MGQEDFQSHRLDFLRAVAKTVGKQALALKMGVRLTVLDQFIQGSILITHIDAENAYQALSQFTVAEKLARQGGAA